MLLTATNLVPLCNVYKCNDLGHRDRRAVKRIETLLVPNDCNSACNKAPRDVNSQFVVR
jgi:hypothetical protein